MVSVGGEFVLNHVSSSVQLWNSIQNLISNSLSLSIAMLTVLLTYLLCFENARSCCQTRQRFIGKFRLVHQGVCWLCFRENPWDLNPDWSIVSRVTCLHDQQKGLSGGVFPSMLVLDDHY
jgi:hypothetical protein